MLNKVWRYSVNEGEYGGIVLADTIDFACEKVYKKYGNEEFCVWEMTKDDYFDTDNPDVFECYGD